MSDELESRVEPREHAPTEHYGETLLYDFAKSMTSVALFVLGGMLTLGGTAQADDISIYSLGLTSAAVAIGGVLSFSVAHTIVDARARGKEPRKNLPAVMKAAAAVFSLGVGSFMMMWLDSLQ